MVDPLHLFPETDRQRIRKAIDEARKSTAAKFEFVVAPASDRYGLFPVIWGGVVALLATGVVALVRADLHIRTGFAIDAGLFVLLSLLFDWWPIRTRLVPRTYQRLCASRMAYREFATSLMSKDEEHNGVMLFVSLAERHFEIIAEREAHEHVPAGTWDRIVADALRLMRSNGTVDGLVSAISDCGRALAAAFPAATK